MFSYLLTYLQFLVTDYEKLDVLTNFTEQSAYY